MIYLNIYRRKNGNPETESFDDYIDAIESLSFGSGEALNITKTIERDVGIKIEAWDDDARYMRRHGGI